jgi:hypothetical protein
MRKMSLENDGELELYFGAQRWVLEHWLLTY